MAVADLSNMFKLILLIFGVTLVIRWQSLGPNTNTMSFSAKECITNCHIFTVHVLDLVNKF